MSAAEVADVPAGVVTVTSTVPVPAGLSAVIVVSLTTVRFVAGVVPKSTAVAPVKLVPVIVTRVPPAVGPLVGLTPVTVGATAAVYVKSSAEDVADVPPGVVTVTSTVPVPAGLSAVIVVPLTTVRFVAGVVPKSTAVAPVKLVPVIVTKVPPAVEPLVGLKLVTVGGRYVGIHVGGGGGRRANRCRHGHVHGSGARRAVGGDRGVVDHGEVRRRRRPEIDSRRARETGTRDRHQGARRLSGPLAGLRPVTTGAAAVV